MKSVADRLAADVSPAVSALTPSERIELALRLGEQAVELFAAANHLGREDARRILRDNNQIGRRRSVVDTTGDL